MKKYSSILSLKWMVSFLLMASFISCSDEDIASGKVDVVEGIATDVILSFDSATPSIQSRGALEIKQEYKVYNLYVFVFNNATGKKEYGHLFELNATNEADKLFDVNEKVNIDDATTSGKVKMKIPSGEKRIYAVANVPQGDSQASLKDELDGIGSITELEKNVVISLKIVERPNDKLVMSGWLQTNDMNSTTPNGYCVVNSVGQNNLSAIKLVRVDARITFNVALDKEQSTPERGETVTERVFTPYQYLVKNAPTMAYLYGKEDNILVDDAEYFSSNNGSPANFEMIEGGVSSFTFYMMENKQSTVGITDYEQREKEIKLSSGVNGEYEFAPATATLVEITGKYFEKYTDESGSIKERYADVKYTIHLGYVNGDANDFRCKRNTTYIYNVYVQSVNKIRLEVTSYDEGKGETEEKQPGAEGEIIETDKYYQFDAHYDHMLVTFNKKNIAGKAGFRVKTPFDDGYYFIDGEEGLPGSAQPVANAKDYKWIKFIKHEKTSQGYGNKKRFTYNKNSYAAFNPGSIITIDKLLKDLHVEAETVNDKSVYDSNGDAVYTMFIDEYYYPCDPRYGHYGEYDSNGNLTAAASDKEQTDFWKQFVNKSNREIHILCNTQYSEDKESSLTTSAVMVSQRSIKTFYNEEASALKTAWGLETINETGTVEPSSTNPWNTDNSSKNGLWNFFNQTGDFSSDKREWDDYISNGVQEDKNGIHDYMKVSKSQKLLYACLQRNRDENGNGKIDASEVKWYPAAIDQYSDIWVGTPALPTETYLYTNQVATEQGYRRYLSSDGKELYAEEGSSIGSFKFQYANSIWSSNDNYRIEKKYDYRCLRNLGMKNGKPNNTADMPQHYVTPSGNILKLTYINKNALRREDNYMKGEITSHNEKSNLNRPYTAFEFKEVLTFNDNNKRWNWNELNSLINDDSQKSPCAQFNVGLGSDEPKWRLPNQRELALMTSNYSSWGKESYVLSRTGSSLPIKNKNNNGYSGGYASDKPFISLATNEYKGPVRCVRDIIEK